MSGMGTQISYEATEHNKPLLSLELSFIEGITYSPKQSQVVTSASETLEGAPEL
jgi:hypothetical protein